MRKNLVSKSKFLSLILRHDPGVIGITLDANGWAPVDELLAKAAARGTAITEQELIEIVETNEKKRFDLDLIARRIRANQGHSIAVDVEIPIAAPPEELFHGTAVRNVHSILAQGLVKGSRQHVHLSSDIETARSVTTRQSRRVSDIERCNGSGWFYILSVEEWRLAH